MQRYGVLATVLLLTACLAFTTTGCGVLEEVVDTLRASETRTYTHAISPDTPITIENRNGDVRIQRSDEPDEIALRAVLKSFSRDAMDAVEITVDDGEAFIITVSEPGTRSRVRVDWEILVPDAGLVQDVKTSNGSIAIRDVRGDVHAASSNGNVSLEGIDGYVRASTSNGRVHIQRCRGIEGARSSNGNVEVEMASVRDETEIATSNGTLQIYLAENLDIRLKARTSNGRIRIDHDALAIVRQEDTEVEATQGAGTLPVNLRTSNGNIQMESLP